MSCKPKMAYMEAYKEINFSISSLNDQVFDLKNTIWPNNESLSNGFRLLSIVEKLTHIKKFIN